MFSRRFNLQGIGPRLVLSTTLLLAVSLICVSTIIYYLLSNSLRSKDHEAILNLTKSYSQAIARNEWTSLDEGRPADIFLQVLDSEGKEILLLRPHHIDHDLEDEDEIEQVVRKASSMALSKGWRTILLLSGEEDMDIFHRAEFELRQLAWEKDWQSFLPVIDNDLFEIYTMQMESGHWIRVGRSSEEREEHLSDIRKISAIVIIPFIFLGFILSSILALKLLFPIKSLAQMIKRLQSGEKGLRAQVKGSQDEVSLLAREFNNLLEHNEKLMTHLKGTIDNVAHDLRTPLTRFRAQAEYALSHQEDVNLMRGALEEAFESSDSILKLLNAIMDVSEAETMTMKIRPEKLELKKLVDELLELFMYSAEEKEIQIISRIPAGLYVEGDKLRLLQAFGNLIDNALKFSDAKSEIEFSAQSQDRKVQISLKDQGCGVDAEDIDRIWDRLYRGDKARSTHGLGIGLSVVKAIVVAHRGRVQVISQKGKGSNFILTLPLCNPPVRQG